MLDELARGETIHPALAGVGTLPWLREVSVDGLLELQAFVAYARRLGSGDRDIGEASTLGWAEVHGAIPILDERAGTRHAKERGLDVHGTIWLIVRGFRVGLLTENRAKGLVDALRMAEAWLPCDGDTLFDFARREGLL